MEFEKQKEAVLRELENDPSNGEVLRSLGDLYSSIGRWSELAEDLESLSVKLGSSEDRVRFCFLAARVWEGQAGSAARAAACYRRVLDEDPAHLEAVEGLKASLVQLEEWPEVIRTLAREAELRDDPADLAEIHYEIGTLWDVKLSDDAEAMRAYQTAFRTDPSCTKALQAARAIYGREEKWAMVAQLLRLESNALVGQPGQLRLLVELGQLLRDRLGDLPAAQAVLEEAMDLDPENEEIFFALASIEQQQNATPLVEPGEAPGEPVRAAEVEAGGAAGEGAGAEAAEPVATVEPPSTVAEAAEPPAGEPASEPALADVGQDEAEESEAEERRGAGKRGRKGKGRKEKATIEETRASPEEEPAVTAKLGQVAEEAEESEVAPVDGAVQLGVAPGIDLEAVAAAAAAAAAEATAVVAAVVAAAASSGSAVTAEPEPEPESEPEIVVEAVAEEPEIVVEAVAEEPVAAAAAEEAEEAEAEPEIAVEAVEVEPEPDAAASTELLPTGLQPDGRMLAPQAAGQVPIAQYKLWLVEAVRQRGEGSLAAVELREVVLVAEESWRDLQTVLRQRFGSEPAGRVAQARRLAVLAEWAGNLDKSVDAWRHVLQGEAADAEAKEALKRLYRSTGKWNAVVDLLKREAEELPDTQVAAKVAVYKEMVEIYRDQLRLDVMVNTTYQSLLKVDPGNLEALDALAEQLEKMRRWPDLVGVLQKRVELLETAAEKIALHKRLANLFAERFSNQAEAIKAYEAVLELAPQDGEAIAYLKEMYEKRRDWEKLVDIHQREAELLPDADARADTLTAVARLAVDKLKRSNRPTQLWERVLELRGEDAAALDALEDIHDKAKDWAALARILQRKVELESVPEREAELWEKLGRLYGERLRDQQAAVQSWQRVLALAPDHSRAREALKRAFIDSGDWDALTAHYAERDDWRELVRILESQVGVIQDEATRVDLLFRAASIYEEKLDQADRAVRVLERVLIIDEENLKASLRLIPVYEEKRDWKRLHRCHEVRLQFTAERPTRREILTTLAGLCQEKLGEPAAAFRWLLAAARENPEDAGLRADLERLAVQLQTWEEVVSLYRENRAALPERPADLLALELQLGRALAEELGETTEAMEAFLRALELDQSCRTALYALEALFKRTARWDDLLDNLGRSFELAADPAERRRLLVEMALVEEEQLGDPPRAAQSYFRVLAELPEDLEALQNLHRLLRGQEEYAQLAEILRRELSVIASAGGAADAEVVELQLELGRILHHRLGRTVEAIGCFSDLLGLTPDHEETITELEGLLDRVELLPRLFEILDPVYESNSQWAKLAGLLERRLALLEEPAARLDMLLRKAEVQDVRLADGQAAFTTYGRALMVDPEDERARLQLLELAERLDCWGELVALHRAVLGPQLPPELACSFQLIIARVEDEKLGHPQQAEEAYRAVLELDPEAKPALDALEQLYTRAEQWERLLEIYLKKRELACDATQREACSFRIGYLWEEMLGNLAEATEVYRAILDEDNGNRQALEALDRLYSAREMWPDLAENLRRQLVLAEGDDALVLTLRLAALLEGELGEAREAIELYHAVLQRRDGDPLATAALERLMVDREHRLTIALLLEPHYQAAGEWEKLSGTLEIQLAAAEDTYDRLQLLHRIAELKELQLQAPRAAFLTYGRALAEMPTDGTTCEQLHRLAEVLGSWAELIQLYEEEVTKLADPELSARFLATCARIYEERLEKIDGALASWHKVLEIEPENVEVIDALIRLLHATEQWSELVEMLRAKIEVAQDPSARIVLLHQAALLYEEMLEDLPRAVAIYRRILELDDRHEAALSALERLYDEQGAWTELLEILERQAELASATSVKKELLARSGELLEARLDERARAVETYRRLLDLDPLDEKTLLALDRLLGAGQDWVGQMEILERRAELVAVPAQRVEIQFRIARLWDVHLDDPLRAVDGYREIVEETPAHAGARAALTEMVRGGRDEQAAAEVMLPLYRRLGEWPLVVEVIELWLVHLADQAERLRLLEEAALVREEQLQDRAAAFATLSRALQEQPQREETLQLLEALSARAGLWPGYVELVEGEAAGKEDELAADLLLRVARALEEELAAWPEAIERFRRVLQLRPQETLAISALDRLYQRQGCWSELAELLRLEIGMTEEPAGRQALMMRLGNLLETVLDAVPQAIAVYQEVLAEDAGHEEALASLERLFAAGCEPQTVAGILAPLYEDERAWEKLISIKEALLPHLLDDAARLLLLKEAALIALEKMGRPDLALYWYGRAFVLAPDEEEVAGELERLADLIAAWDDLVNTYLDAHERVEDARQKAQILLRVARVFEEELRDRQHAEQCFEGVLTLDEKNRAALLALDRLYQVEERWADLSGILEREIQLEEDEVTVIGLVYRLARLFEHQLGDLDLAVDHYCSILATDPLHDGALKALENIYVQREEWEPLFDVYQKQADIADAGHGKAQIYAKMARLASEMLERPSEAIAMWNKVIDLLGDDLDALQALAVLHEQEGQWRELVEVLQRQARVVDDGTEEARLLARQGRILGQRLGDDASARLCWEQVLALEPEHGEALLALRQIYRKSQAWEELVSVLERLLELRLGTAEEQVALWAELGRLEADTLQRAEAAIEAWRQVLALRPEEMEAITSLERLYESEEDWGSCAEILEVKAERISEPEAKVETLLRVAAICLEKTWERERAVAFLEGVLELDPPSSRASLTLERIFAEDGDAARLLDVLLRRLEHAADPLERVQLMRRSAAICEDRLSNPVNAFYCISRAFQEIPAEAEVAGELERLARLAGQWEGLLDLYEGMIPQSEPALQLELHRKIGRIYAQELDAPDEAIAAYQQVLRSNRNDQDALAALEQLFRQAERWAELVAVLQLRVEGEEDPEQLAAHFNQMGEILEEQLRITDRAVDAYRQVLKHREDDELALASLERIFTREGKWRELIDILSRRALATLEADRVITFKERIGEIWENRLQVADRAIEAYREILRLDPLNVDACRSLERLYTAQDKWRELVEIYEVWLAAVDDPDLQCDLLTKTAVIQEEEFHDAPAATLAYERILQLQPEHLHAIRSLERLNRALGRWPELIEVYRRHLDAARGDLDVSINLLQATGSIFAGQLRDRDQAIESYRRILDLDPQHRQALQALAGLYEQAGDWEATVAMLQQLRDVLDDRAARVELAFRVGLIQRNEMQDEAQAEEWFYQALDEDPYYLPAIEHLREMAYQRQDWRGAVQLLKRQEEATRDLLEKAKVLLAIGKIYQERENDPLSASTYFERCIEYDPENVEAASPLVEMYLHERRWERAEPLLDLLVRRLGKSRHTEGIHQIHHQAGLCSENLFKDDKALRHYRNAYELDATHLPTLEGLGRLLYKREDWDRAFKIYQTILVHHRDKQTDAQQVEIFFRLGVIKLKVGERARGRQMFEKALELDQHHRPTLEGLVDLHEKQGDWDKVVHYKRAMLATLDGEDLKRFDLLVDVANIWREKLRNMAKAIEAYNEALAIDPQSRQVMHHLLNLYTQEKEWPYAVEILLRTIQLEERPDKVARYCYTAGVIYRDELKDDEQAVALFNQALDADPGMLKAFEAIDRIQTRIKAWQLLERNYRKMIKRVTDTGCGGEELQVLLWRNLGEIYRTRMIRHEEAATAFGMASKIMPKDMQLHEIIAELYDRSPDSKDKALAEHRRMLELEKFRYSSYKALSRLYAETNQFDKAWCFAAALSLARQASAEEDEFYKRFRGQTLKYANRPLEREMWQNLYHPAENLHLGGIFATLALYNPFPTSSLKDWNVKKRDLLELSKPLVFNKVFKTTVQALNMTSHVPQVYLKGEGHMGMKNGYTEPWSLIIGPDMLQGRPERELAFLLGKALTLFRPEHYLAGVLPTSHLKILFYAALKLTHPESNVPLPTEAEAFAEILRHMQKTLPPPILADLDKRVSLVLRARIEVDLSGWLDGVDATSNRVGLLLCGDLETATRLIRSEQGAIGKASAQQRAEDLFLWSISEEYFSLRKALGLTIG